MNQYSLIRIIVVDDHPLVRESICYLCLATNDIDLVGEAANGKDALKLCADLQPDVALVDLMMPDMDGIATIEAIRAQYPQVRIVVLTSFNTDHLINEAMKKGANSYILKNASTEDIINSIRLTYKQMTILSPDVVDKISSQSSFDALTPRQLQVLQLMSKGFNNVQISKEISVSAYTVRFHVSEILSKLGVSNRAEAVAVALKEHLIS